MTKLDKIKNLEKHLQNLKNRQTMAIPEKHKNHIDTFKKFLHNEIETVTSKIQELKAV